MSQGTDPTSPANKTPSASLGRYARQVAFEPLGLAGQKALCDGRVLIVGVGGLGSWAAELLARAGVGFLRLADADRVDLTNIHRQALYDERDAAEGLPKVEAARRRLGKINHETSVEAVAARVDRRNVERLSADVQVVIDGTDNFATRFLLNDCSVKHSRPWVFAGCVRAEWQTMTIVPGRTACLRCVLDSPPPPCEDPACRQVGVLGPAVASVAALEAAEAIKILAGRPDAVRRGLLRMDLWGGSVQTLTGVEPRTDCPCCGRGEFEFLEP
jgi:molybdopterin-synthase adenylyltransferase